ncbi:MAG TPA: SPOR domain-containing protein [Steroidobacteraceae bacterium]|nr:SPOR domain-containing protein [Steroidobacteraceae bacterium]
MTTPSGVGGARTLSRDYKNVRRMTPGGASGAFSGWVGLLVGLAVGLSVALGVFLHYRVQPPVAPKPEAKTTPRSAEATEDSGTAGTAPPAGSKQDKFTFYDDLKTQQVEVPESAPRTAPKRTGPPKGEVTLQAGSFKQQAEAEKMVAKLALAGIQAKVQRFPMDDETWFRVRIGPIATVQELDSIRTKLGEADIIATEVSPMAEAAPPP